MKKFISVALAVLMILSVVPMTAFAAGVTSTPATGDKITSNVCSIWYMKDGVETKLGDYNNLDEAFEALKPLFVSVYDSVTTDGPDADTNLHNEYYEAAGSPVIKLNGNFDGGYARPNWCTDKNVAVWQGFYDPNKVPTFVIDGAKSATENYTVTYANGTMFNTVAYYNLTIKNTNLEFGNNGEDNSICWNGNDTSGMAQAPGETYTVFENCKITQNSTAGTNTGSGGLFKLNGRAKNNSGTGYVDPCETDKYNLILKDTTINTYAGIGLQVHWGADANIEMHNSVWTHSGKCAANDNNDAILKAYECGDINIYLDGTSKLVGAVTDGATTVTLIRMNDTARYPITITLEKGAELSLQNTSNTLKHSTYIASGSWGNTTVIDNGAVYKASAKDAALGVNLYPIGNEKIWFANGEAINGELGLIEGATADVVFTNAIPVDPAAGKVAYIEINGEKTYYTTLKNAMDALGAIYDAVTTPDLTDEALWQAAGSPVIYLYEDVITTGETYPSWGTDVNYDINRVRTVVIKGVKADGKNPVITSTVAGAAFGYLAYYNFTLEDVDLNCTQGFALFWRGYNGKKSGKATTNMINCNITATGTSGEGLVFKVTGNQDVNKMTEEFIINFVNTDVVAKAGVNAVFLFHHGAAGTVNIDGNSSITHTNAHSAAGGDTIFMLGSNRKFVINVEDGAELTANAKETSAGVYSLIRTENSNAYPSADGIKNVINIKSGAKLTINADDAFAKPVVFINQLTSVSNGNTYVNIEEGATFSVNAKAAELGFTTITTTNPYLTNDAEKSLLGWNGVDAEGNSTFYASGVFAAGAVTGAVTVSPAFYSEDDFVMLQGAGYKEGGILFGFEVSDALVASFGEDAVYGIMVAPTEYTQWGFNKDMLSLSQRIELTTDATGLKDGNGVQYCYLGFDGIPTDDVNATNVEISAIGFIEYKNEGGNTVTIYTANTYAITYAQLAAAAAK